MTSFIEVPRLHYDGRDNGSVYVNTDDIITIVSDWQGMTRLEVRNVGSEGMPGTFVSYLELGHFLDALSYLVQYPGVRSWDPNFKQVAAAKVRPLLQEQAARERAAR